jgi:hypothetical protein
MTQTFAGYLHGLFKTTHEARALQPYVLTRTCRYGLIRERVLADTAKGTIDLHREGRLLGWLDRLHEGWLSAGKLLDSYDPKDWHELGNGARMRQKHLPGTGGKDDPIV